MAASGFTPIQLYYSTTPAAQPSSGDLISGELALNIADGYLYYKNVSGIVKNLAGLSGYSGISGYSGFSGISGYSGAAGPTTYPSSGFAISTGSAWDTSLPDPLQVGHGGTGLSAVTAGYIPFGNSSTTLGTSSLINWSTANTRLGVGIATPVATVHLRGGNSNNLIVDNDGSQFTTMGWYNNGTEKAQGYFDATNSLFVFGTDVAAPLVFKANTVEGMRLSSGGGVSIGTSTGAGTGNLLVNGSVTAASHNTTNFTIIESAGKLLIKYGTTTIASIDSSGNFTSLANVTAYGTP